MMGGLLAPWRQEMTQQPGPGLLAGAIPNRSALLPLSKDEYGRVVPAWPQAAVDAWRLMQLPGKALMGKAQPTPADTMEMALGMVGGGTLAGTPKGALGANSIRAYHGSPHDFDKFSLDKIGTGEGAQAYGHGLYFAEKEGVARSYRDALSSGKRGVDEPIFNSVGKLKTVHPDTAHDIAENGAEAIKKRLAEIDDTLSREAENRRFFGDEQTDEMMGFFKREKAELEALAETDDFSTRKGHMYEVNIKADPEDFLDWDKPLSEQSAKVQEALGEFNNTPKDIRAAMDVWQKSIDELSGSDSPRAAARIAMAKKRIEILENRLLNAEGQTAADFYSHQRGYMDTGKPDDLARKLRQQGIPGIKYLDQGSRAAGDGSRNYVVFDDELIEILRKYGLAGLMAGGAGGGGLIAGYGAPGMEN